MHSDQPIQTRWIELLVAVCFAVAGIVVVLDRQRVGNAWASDGPQPGYFPFYIGSLMLAGAAWVFLHTCLRWRLDGGREVFAHAKEWRLMLMMLLPTVTYLVSMAWLGIYLSSCVFIAAFMVWQGRFTYLKSLLVGLSISAALFLLFEIWFLLPLPKGPLETWLGY